MIHASLLTLLLFFLFLSCESTPEKPVKPEKKDEINLGLFLNTVYRGIRLFENKENIDNAIKYAVHVNAKTLFVHVYMGDRCYFSYGRKTSKSYRRASRRAGVDLLDYLLNRAREAGIKCYAWFNAYAFTPGRHYLFKKYGRDVLTRDQYNRPYDGRVYSKGRDKYYRRDTLAWLEPGDPRVQKYLYRVLKRLVCRYPLLEGVQLDFIRYPIDPPFIPGGRYMKWGYSAGYGRLSVKRFYKEYKFYPNSKTISLERNRRRSGMEKSLIWDQWRRDQITDFITMARELCTDKKMKLTASVFAYADRVYFHGFQNWRNWLKSDYVDFVILMNYSTDSEMVYHITKQHNSSYPGRIWNGLGAYVMKSRPRILEEQLRHSKELGVPGVVLFEYFAIRNSKNISSILSKTNEYTMR